VASCWFSYSWHKSTASTLERGKVKLGVERAKVHARAVKTHPAAHVLANQDVERESPA
jgi:hypothetical protein